MITTIFLDMDGVLCDFDKRYEEIFGCHPKDTPRGKQWDNNWMKFIAGQNFATLDWHPEGPALFEGVMNLAYDASENGPMIAVEILSSSARKDTHDQIDEQKRVWLGNNFVNIHTNIVPGRKFKKLYAKQNTLLIDDMPSNVDEFIAAGGHAILHNGSAKHTLSQLYHLIEMNNSKASPQPNWGAGHGGEG